MKEFIKRCLHSSIKVKMIAVVVILTTAAFAFHSYQAKSTATGQRAGNLTPIVDAYSIIRNDMVRQIELSGQTVPESQVNITAKYSGKITQVNVNLGDQVTPGQLLVMQDTKDVDATLAQNEAALRQATADTIASDVSFNTSYQKAQSDYQLSVSEYQRYKTLYGVGGVSKEALDKQEQQMAAAKSTVDSYTKQIVGGNAASVASKQAASDKEQGVIDSLQIQKNDMIIRAPRAGVIGFRQAEVGMMAQPGQELLSIVDNSNIYVDCAVSEQDIGQIAMGTPVSISLESLGKSYTGKVIYISPAMDPKTQTFTVRMSLDNRDDSIKTGMFARTDINVVLRQQTLFVPKEAVVSLNGTNRVFVIDDKNQVSERTVQLGLRNDKYVEILSGVNEGEKVAITNLSRIKAGMNVKTNDVSQ